MKLDVAIDDKLVVQGLTVEAPGQLPYVAAATLTAVAADAAHDLTGELASVFDRPVDFTLRGPRSRSANQASLTSEAYIADSAPEGGKGAREYIRPAAERTYARQQKKTEFLLARLGALPRGWVTTPGKGAQLDGHGNLAGSIYKQIINVLQLKPQILGGAFRGVSQRSQRQARRLGVESLYFVAVPGNRLARGGGRLPPGVWKHTGPRSISQILRFVPKAGYQPRLDVVATARKTLANQLALRWRESAIRVNARFLAGRK